MTDTRQTLPAAGWYYDPGNHSHVRWWNGNAWTDNAVPVPRVAPADGAAPVRQSLATDSAYDWDRESRFREAFDDEAPSVVADDGTRGIPTRWFTAPMFAVAATPLVAVLALAALMTVAVLNDELYSWWSIGPVLLPWLWGVAFAARDNRALVRLRYPHPANPVWALLGAPVYLLVRTIATRRAARLGGGALLVWVANLGVAAALVVGGVRVMGGESVVDFFTLFLGLFDAR